ncbi:MAG: hypothetical protein IPJ06_07695 [Saprospiraceae bacterium]|nr:hypothetical protein [Saprospiraceae bacterium]
MIGSTARNALDMDARMRTLDITNRNVAEMSEDPKHTVQRFNSSVALWEIRAMPTCRNMSTIRSRACNPPLHGRIPRVADVSAMIEEVANAKGERSPY